MASNVDETKPTSVNPTTESVRNNFLIIKTEIETLQSAIESLQSSVGSGGSTSVTFSDTPPAFPHENKMWWSTTLGELFINYENNWVSATPVKNGKDGVDGQNGIMSLAEFHAAAISF